MKVTQLVFDAFLRCPTKRYLIARGEAGDRTAAERVDEAYRQDGLERLNAELSSDVTQRRTSAGRPLEAGSHGLIGRLDAETHPVRIQAHERQRDRDHVPIRFVSEEEVSLTPKLSLAFDALVLAESTGTRPLSGEIIHGRDYPTVKVPLSALYPKVQSSLTALNQQLTSATAPDPVLNKHCAECRYMARCREIAEKADDLSLLARMSARERQHFHQKGIFTVTQLSHTFRHRRRGNARHDHSLKALAVQKKQTHVNGKVEWKVAGTPVYIDVEGDPGGGFYYCVGLRYRAACKLVERSYWADSPADEANLWAECLSALESIDDPMLVHFGSYEASFLRNMGRGTQQRLRPTCSTGSPVLRAYRLLAP